MRKMTSRVVIILDQVSFVTETELKTRFPKKQNKNKKTEQNNNNKKPDFPESSSCIFPFISPYTKYFWPLGLLYFEGSQNLSSCLIKLIKPYKWALGISHQMESLCGHMYNGNFKILETEIAKYRVATCFVPEWLHSWCFLYLSAAGITRICYQVEVPIFHENFKSEVVSVCSDYSSREDSEWV